MSVDGFGPPDLASPLDLEERLEALPPGLTVRGFIFSAVTQRLGLTPTRYVPYRSYPLDDFLRLLARAGERGPPAQRLREAGRLVWPAFRGSMIGSVLLSLGADSIEGALEHAPRMYRLGVSFGTVEVIHRGPRRAEVRLRDVWAFHPYLFGFIEGIAHYYDPSARVLYRRVALNACDFLVEW